MRLSTKITLNSTALIVGLVLLGTASLWGLEGLRNDVRLAREEYGELRRIERIEVSAAEAKGYLLSYDLDPQAVAAAVRRAIDELEHFLESNQEDEGPYDHQNIERSVATLAIDRLNGVLARMDAVDMVDGLLGTPDGLVETIDLAMDDVQELARKLDATVEATHDSANRNLRRTRAVIAVLSLVIIAGAIAASVWQFRSVMNPVGRLREAVRRVAQGRFEETVDIPNEDELADLAHEFNRMAAELDNFYRRLEEMVAAKSHELARSERLASVGFLAAGVAHEINNPLSIIAGYAQASLQDLGGDDPGTRELRRVLQVICDESFRCKQIVQKLLSLARPTGERLAPVPLDQVVRDTAGMVRGLPGFGARGLDLQIEDGSNLTVNSNRTELMQVLLNLTVNALEATDPLRGRITLRAWRENSSVFAAVEDDGRGMSPAELQQAFEPFFTTKRGTHEHGTGLGLSICHAIIKAHGGRITARSDGPGRGSGFTIELPSLEEQALHGSNQ